MRCDRYSCTTAADFRRDGLAIDFFNAGIHRRDFLLQLLPDFFLLGFDGATTRLGLVPGGLLEAFLVIPRGRK